jgi:hypothetical protein
MGLPDRRAVEAEVRKLLDDAVGGHSSFRRKYLAARSDDLFEAIILLTFASRAKLAPAWTVELNDINDKAVSALWLRRNPGRLGSPTNAYTHVVLSSPSGGRFEVHGGIRIRGHSRQLHEADVSVLDRVSSRADRDKVGDPTTHEVLLTVEAKWLSDQTTPLGYGRGAVGLQLHVQCHCQRPAVWLATSSANGPVKDLLDHYDATVVQHLADYSAGALSLTELDDAVDACLARWP